MERKPTPGPLRRPRLERRLDEGLERRLTLVTADAGFGKSTLLAQWADERPAAWLNLTHDERHVGRLVMSIVGAIRGAANLSVERETGTHQENPSPDALASWLAIELASRLERNLVLVLDDVQELGSRGAAPQFLEALVLQAPAKLHLVLASRSGPPFRTQRLRGHGEVLEITASALAFRPEEIEALLAESLGPSARALTTPLGAATEGWPAAVRLAIEVLRPLSASERLAAIDRLRKTDSPVLTHLAEEVIGHQPEGVKEYLRRMAILDQFTVDSSEALGFARSRATIDRLLQTGLAVRRGDVEFALHALIRDFALARMALTADERGEVHRRAAAWFESAGDIAAALQHAIDSGDAQGVRRLLVAHGERLTLSGQASAVTNAASAVSTLDTHPELNQVIGEAYAVRGEWDKALASYRRAASGPERPTARLAWLHGQLEWDRGHLDDAFDAFSRGTVDGSRPADEALLLASRAIALWNRGETKDAETTAEEALECATRSGDSRALAYARMAVGMTAIGWPAARRREQFRLALGGAEESGDVLLAIRLHVNLCAISPPADGLAEIEPAIHLAEMAGADIPFAIALNTRGEDLLALGRYDDAAVDLRHAIRIFEASGSTRATWALMNLGDVARERGDLALARSFYDDADRRAKQADDAQGLICSRAGTARLLALAEPEEARELAHDAVERARPLQLYVARSLLAAGWVAAVQNRVDEAQVISEEAETAARDQGWPSAVAEALELRAMSAGNADQRVGLLEDARAVWREIGSDVGVSRVDVAIASLRGDRVAARRATRRLRILGVSHRAADAAGILACLSAPAATTLEIRTLGGFAVIREGRPVAIGAWRSRKARDVLKMLVARRGRPIPREELVEIFWPAASPAEASNRLSVATSLIRSVLDPGKEHPPNHFVEADRESLALVRNRVSIDVEDFLAEAEAGLRASGEPQSAVAMLEDAEAIYAGDFLEEDAYQDWAVGLREEARATYIAVARRLAQAAAARGGHDVASRYLRRVLERDRYDESAHLDLVRSLAEAGQHGEARRAYRAYVGRMDELEVEPSPYPA